MVPVATSELHAKMAELANFEEIYSMKHLKRKLEEGYKDDIISQTEGKPNLVCFKDVTRFIIEKSRERKCEPRRSYDRNRGQIDQGRNCKRKIQYRELPI